ncbi:MAG: hypothetical protein JST23_08085 [Bacteroidetes bacterium]|nr:hypothetical protein [Bacteroidota bacterium]
MMNLEFRMINDEFRMMNLDPTVRIMNVFLRASLCLCGFVARKEFRMMNLEFRMMNDE